MKANKLRNHPYPTHQQLVEEQEEKIERQEDSLAINEPVDEDDAPGVAAGNNEIEQTEPLKA